MGCVIGVLCVLYCWSLRLVVLLESYVGCVIGVLCGLYY